MESLRRLVCLALPLLAPTAAAQSGGEGFSALLALSSDASVEDRFHRTPGDEGAALSTDSRVVHGQVLTAYVLFRNAAADEQKRIAVEVDLVITGPDGTEYASQERIPAYAGAAPASAGRALLATSNARFAFDASDAAGAYGFRATVRDLVAKARTEARADLELVARVEPAAFASAKEAGDWIGRYYERPQPERAVPALRLLAESGAYASERSHHVRAAFFRELFDGNPHLFPELAAAAEQSSGAVQAAALELLGTCRTPEEQRWQGLTEALRERCRSQGPSWDPARDPIATPANLDELWAAFFATGTYAPIRRLVSVIERQADLEQTVFGAAAWSLESNARRHALVRNYLAWMSENDELTDFGRTVLARVLEKSERR